jgi:pyruvate formate lyase activating enzyme
MQEITRDKAFYQASCGGVTFSGGECLRQSEAVKELLERCAALGIHTAIDTSGDAKRSLFEEILPLTGLFLYDFKCAGEKKHKEFTGLGNREILDNLAYLLKTAPNKVWIRVPVIPGFNANNDELEKIRAWLEPLPAPARIEILPYHRLGENKMEALGMKSSFMPDVPNEEIMKAFKNIFSIPIP